MATFFFMVSSISQMVDSQHVNQRSLEIALIVNSSQRVSMPNVFLLNGSFSIGSVPTGSNPTGFIVSTAASTNAPADQAPTSAQKKPDEGMPLWLIIVIIGAVLLFIAIIVVIVAVVVIKKKKQREQDEMVWKKAKAQKADAAKAMMENAAMPKQMAEKATTMKRPPIMAVGKRPDTTWPQTKLYHGGDGSEVKENSVYADLSDARMVKKLALNMMQTRQIINRKSMQQYITAAYTSQLRMEDVPGLTNSEDSSGESVVPASGGWEGGSPK